MAYPPSLSSVRQVKIAATAGARSGSRTSRVLVRPLGSLHRHRVRHALGPVPVGRGPDVPPGEGVLTQAAPGLLLDLQPEPLGNALLDPAYQDGGGVGAGDVDRLVGGE